MSVHLHSLVVGDRVRRKKRTEQERRKDYRQCGTVKGFELSRRDHLERAIVYWDQADASGLDKQRWHRARTLFQTEVLPWLLEVVPEGEDPRRKEEAP